MSDKDFAIISMWSAVFLFMVFLAMSGCASETAYKNYLTSQEISANSYYAAVSKPLLDVTLPAPEGKEYKIVVNREVKPMPVSQIKDREWVDPVKVFTITAGLVAAKGFDWQIKKSDNAATVDIAKSHDTAVTTQIQDYTDKFSKEKNIETTAEQ